MVTAPGDSLGDVGSNPTFIAKVSIKFQFYVDYYNNSRSSSCLLYFI